MDVQTLIMAIAMGVLYWIANGYLGRDSGQSVT